MPLTPEAGSTQKMSTCNTKWQRILAVISCLGGAFEHLQLKPNRRLAKLPNNVWGKVFPLAEITHMETSLPMSMAFVCRETGAVTASVGRRS